MKRPYCLTICFLFFVSLPACSPPITTIPITPPIVEMATAVIFINTPLPTPTIIEATKAISTSSPTAPPTLTPKPSPSPPLEEEALIEPMTPIVEAANITMGDWSPNGRYFTYWTHSPEDLTTAPFAAGDFYIYDAEQGRNCPFSGYRTGSTSWKRRHLWMPNGNILIFGDEEVVRFQPCSHNFEILTERFPESVTRVVTATADRSYFLLTSQARYWLYRSDADQVRPVLDFAQGMEGGASFSPNGRFVALNGDEDGSYLLDVNTAKVTQIASWQSPMSLGGLAAPEWISDTQFVIRSSRDLGPLLIDVDGTVQNVGLTFFGRATAPDSAVFVQRDDVNGRFHLHLETFGNNNAVRLYHSEIDDSEDIISHSHSILTENGRWLLIHSPLADNNSSELWVQSIDPANSLPARIAVNAETIYTTADPVADRLAVRIDNRIELMTIPDGTILGSYAVDGQDIYPISFSGNGRFLTLLGNKPSGEEALFILSVDSLK